jgi:hypothetical protein
VPGIHWVEDPETGRRQRIWWSRRNVQRYAHAMRQRKDSLTEVFYRMGLDFLSVGTGDTDVVDRLVELFLRRRTLSWRS